MAGNQVRAQNLAIIGCDSADLSSAFGMSGKNQSFIGVDSGIMGTTSTGALARAGFALARSIIEGASLDQAVGAANRAIRPSTNQTVGGRPINLTRSPIDINDKVVRVH